MGGWIVANEKFQVLLVRQAEPGIHVNGVYTQTFNRRHRKFGHLI